MLILANANTAAGALTLNINSRGAKPIYINGVASSSTNYTLPAGSYMTYYDGTNYHIRTDGILPGKILSAGTADIATKLAAAKTIAISGGATGTATSFDGSSNITIPVTALDVSKANAGTLAIARGGTNLTSYTKGDLIYASAANTLAKLAIGTSDYLLAVTSGLPAWKKPADITVGIATKLGSSTIGSKTIPIWLENGLPKVTEMDYAGENMIPTAYLGIQGNGVTDVYDRFTATHTLTVSSGSTAADTAYLGLVILNNKVLIPWGHYFTLTCEIWSPVDAVFGYDENTALETAADGYTGNNFYTNHTGSSTNIPANTWTKVWYQHANLRTPTSTAGAN